MTSSLRLLFWIPLLWIAVSCSGQEYDLLIKNGSIIDGSGSEAFSGHVLVKDGIIEKVGDFDPGDFTAKQTIDANGRTVSPGFVDVHSRGVPQETPRFDNFLSQGVTTITLGLIGRSLGGEDVAGWMEEVDDISTGPGVIHLTGHSTLRNLTDSPRNSEPNDEYLSRMKEILSESMRAGSFGLSYGLEFEPGSYAGMPELVALANTAAENGGMIMGHVRSEDDDRIESSVTEILNIARESGAPLNISHLKIVYADDPQRAEDVLDLMNEARDEGLTITADLYPYVASFTTIGIIFPEWARPPNEFSEVVENRRDELAEYLRNRVNLRNGPEATLFGTEPWIGQTLADVAEELNKPFEDVLIDDIGPEGASAAYFVMNEEVMKRFLTDPYVMVSSDGGPEMRHPRGYGSFARIIRQYVNEENLMPLEEAIYKMSGLPAETLGLTDSSKTDIRRGLIREGFAADLLIFDPANVWDNATFEDPHQYAEGFEWVFVNGTAVIDEGVRNDQLPSGIIRRKQP
ncbi:N-acyl-D-amino acid deacylase [Rhodohalobacter sp. SW132]|uniref:N-acyl-D-amino-acid deacylase family protein n=1 Tax=Rhodohalobacter sp. SW132 TaxID=2293433 RepID=UPI000E2838D8|nr:amidohydrolase family protein [Rhodohalobacter sp. SW132]REL38960.1 N-acyl-D-amino acid deacylase [Rhodohalobacter sp. SW132]